MSLHWQYMIPMKVLLFRLALLVSITITHSFSFTTPHKRDDIRGTNRIFLDTAVVDEWNELLPLGIFYGITTNPKVIERAGIPCNVPSIKALASQALKIPECKEIMCQVWGVESEEMFSIGMELSKADRERIVVKVPVTYEGTKAASKLIDNGVRVCLTACYSTNQAMIAAGLGAEYIAPYLGRMMDAGKDGPQECKEMQKIVNGMGSNTRVLVASIRSANTVADLTSSGMNTFTFNPDVARELFDEPLTYSAVEDLNETVLKCGVDESND